MGVGIVGSQYLWPNRTIPYEIDPAFRVPERIAEAMAHWMARTSIRFVPRNGEADYLRIVREPGMALSDVGRRSNMQLMRLGDGCTVGTVIHELGHVVGLCHEHCHPSRDQWVRIVESNIAEDSRDDFRLHFVCGAVTPTRSLGEYDYGSIMHYRANACAEYEEDPTIVPLRPIPEGVEMGQRKALSAGDIAAVETLYAGVPKPMRRP